MPASARVSTIDEQLLAALERAFAHHAGGGEAIDAAKLQHALGMRSEYLARRVLAVFDEDGDGAIDHDEFLAGVRRLVFGSEEEKLRFAFRLHDEDGDGFIGRLELLRMIAISLAEAEVQTRASQPPERLAQVLLGSADRDRDGKLSFAEFEAALRRHPRLLAQMTHSEAAWIAPNEDLLARLDAAPPSAIARLARWLDNRRLPLLWLALIALGNAALFAHGMLALRGARALNLTMQLGRAAGACLELDAALILWPVMRRGLSWARARGLARLVPIDEALGLHRLLGHALFALGIGHALAFCASYASGHPNASLGQLVFESRRGLTGVLALATLGAMWGFALPHVRRSSRFELFYFSHLLYAAWFALVLVHAPEFAAWVAVPAVAWALELVARARRHGRSSAIVASQALRSGVTRLELERPEGFAHKPGDFVFLRIPALARHEWHPFTLSSAPERSALSLHVRSLGNWTSALRRLVETRRAEGNDAALAAELDGPYGSPSTHIFEARYAVLIGAGIGVTPFASVLESLVLRANLLGERPAALRKVHFFWLNHDQYAFEWFAALLAELEVADHRDLLEIHICMTGGTSGATAAGLEVAREVLHAGGQRDLVTGLKSMTHMGHPDFGQLLAGIAAQHAPEPVEVFFCGPSGLARKLKPICARLGMRFREERF